MTLLLIATTAAVISLTIVLRCLLEVLVERLDALERDVQEAVAIAADIETALEDNKYDAVVARCARAAHGSV